MLKGRHRSPDDGAYVTGYRGFGRGGKYRARGPPPRPLSAYPPPPPPPSKGDILMEAGRLAAEYLVARGILPASSLPPRWQQNGGSQELRSHNSPRMSALDRLGAANSDGRRHQGEEYPPQRGWGKRAGSYNGRDRRGEWGRESSGRAGNWVERTRSFDDGLEQDDDSAPGYSRRGGMGAGTGTGMVSRSEGELSYRSGAMESESDLDNNDGSGDGGSVKAGSSGAKDEGGRDTDAESNRDSGGGNRMDEPQNLCDTDGGDVQEKKDEMEVELGSLPPEPPARELASKYGGELLMCCRYLNVPRRPRSTVERRCARNGKDAGVADAGSRAPEVEPEVQDEDKPDVGCEIREEDNKSIVVAEEVESESFDADRSVDEVAQVEEPDTEGQVVDSEGTEGGLSVSFINVIPSSSSLPKEGQGIAPACLNEEPAVPTAVVETEKKPSLASSPFPKSSPVKHPSELVTGAAFTSGNEISHRSYLLQESSFGACPQLDSTKIFIPDTPEVISNSVVDGGLPRQNVSGKRPRDWYSDIVTQTDDCVNPCNMNKKRLPRQGGTLIVDREMVEVTNHGKTNDTKLFQGTEAESHMAFQEGGQLLANSFKTCDLNLIGTPEITDAPSSDPIHESFSSTGAVVQTGNVSSMNFGPSIGDDIRKSNSYGEGSRGSKVVQVIDLEDDSPVEDGVCDTSRPRCRNEALYINLERFLNNPVGTVDLPDIQDGYANEITELLGSDITSCPGVTAEINNLQSGIALHGPEGIAGDDDSIYVSLDEIGYMDIWDPPHQEYGKYF